MYRPYFVTTVIVFILSVVCISYIKMQKTQEDFVDSKYKKESVLKDNLMAIEPFSIYLDVEKYQLENGLTILLYPDHNIPYIYHSVTVNVGSVDEVEGKTGLAHLFEHMMFRGTKRFPNDSYTKKLGDIGALFNAATYVEKTVYHSYFSSEHLEMILDIESDRIQNLVINQDLFEKELEVVKEERRTFQENNPNSSFELLMSLMYRVHPYGRPIIGSMKDLEAMSTVDLKQFYNKYYTSSNIVLVVGGDFQTQKIKPLIKKYYGVLKPTQLQRREKVEEPEQKQMRYAQYERAIQAPTITLSYRVPPRDKEDSYALDILSFILTAGESSRLRRLLVNQTGLVLSVDSDYYGALKEEGRFLIHTQLNSTSSIDEVKKIIRNEIEKIRQTPISNNELLKSQRAIMLQYISSLKTLSGKVRALVENEFLFSDYREFFNHIERYNKVTASAIQNAATQYLSHDNVSLVELVPMKKRVK